MHITLVRQQETDAATMAGGQVIANSQVLAARAAEVAQRLAISAMSSSANPSQASTTSRNHHHHDHQHQQIGDPFDGSSEPIVYMSDNRMPVMIEFSNVIIYIIFAALLLALVSILPGVRRKKFTSFLSLLTILLVGASILLSLEGSYWLQGELQVHEAPYGALTGETITGKLEVNIGLKSTNVTLYGRLMGDLPSRSHSLDNTTEVKTAKSKEFVDYNEKFHWDKPDRMASEHEEALKKGLPYPILTITEFLSQDSDGFNWMRQLRTAGYFTSITLYVSLVSWCLTTVVMCMLPVYLPHMMQITGALMMGSVWIYALLIQSPKTLVMQLGETPIEFAFGYSYMLTFMAGAISMFAGILIYIVHMNQPHDQLTIMDCDTYLKNQKAIYGSHVQQHWSKSCDINNNNNDKQNNISLA